MKLKRWLQRFAILLLGCGQVIYIGQYVTSDSPVLYLVSILSMAEYALGIAYTYQAAQYDELEKEKWKKEVFQ